MLGGKREHPAYQVGMGILVILTVWASVWVADIVLGGRASGTLELCVESARSVEDLGSMGRLTFYIDELVAREMENERFEFDRFAKFEFVKTLIDEAKDLRQLSDVKYVLDDVWRDSLNDRPLGIRLWDQGLLWVRAWFGLSGKFFISSALIRKGRDLRRGEEKILRAAKVARERGQLRKAVRLYEKLIAGAYDYRNLIDLQFDLSYAYLRLGRFQHARAILVPLRQRGKGSREELAANFLIGKTRALEKLGEKDLWLANLSSSRSPEKVQQAYMKIGLFNFQRFHLQRAEEAFVSASTVVPDSPLALKALLYAGIVQKLQDRYNEAVRTFQSLIARAPKSSVSLYSRYELAESYRRAGAYERAGREFESVASDFPDSAIAPFAQFRAGYLYFYSLGDPKRAAARFDRLKENFGGESVARYAELEIGSYVKGAIRDFGFALLKRGLYRQARTAFEEAIANDRKDAWAYSGLATVMALLGEKEAALQKAEEAVKISADEYTVGALGYVSELNRDYRKGLDHYQKAVAMKTAYPSALFNLARLQELSGDYDRAIETYLKVIELSRKGPKQAEAYNNLGHAYWYKGQLSEALEQFKKAVEVNPDSVEAHYNLALFYQGQKRYDLAIEEYQVVLALNPNFRQAELALRTLRKKS